VFVPDPSPKAYFDYALLFALETEVTIPLPVELSVNEDVLVVKDGLGSETNTVQLSLVGTQASLLDSSSGLSSILSIDPNIADPLLLSIKL
jgi:hypothetical protein